MEELFDFPPIQFGRYLTSFNDFIGYNGDGKLQIYDIHFLLKYESATRFFAADKSKNRFAAMGDDLVFRGYDLAKGMLTAHNRSKDLKN